MILLRRLPFLFLLPLAFLPACTREPQPADEKDGTPVMFSLDTKALPGSLAEAKQTVRVALFSDGGRFSGRTGTYCKDTYTYSDYTWLQPCRVDEFGQAMDGGDPGSAVSALSDADHDGGWGLRWRPENTSATTVSLTAVMPAVALGVVNDTQDPPKPLYAYVPWTPDTEVYISEPVESSFKGIWFDNQYVYHSSGSAMGKLVDPRASIKVRIQCSSVPDRAELLPQAWIHSVAVEHRIVEDRFYLMPNEADVRGFTMPGTVPETDDYGKKTASSHYRFAEEVSPGATPDPLDNSAAPLSAAARQVTKEGATWSSDTRYYLAARDYSRQYMADMRPRIVVKLSAAADTAPEDQVTAKVPLAQKLDPMKDYTYVLEISNAYVSVHLLPGTSWEDGGNPATVGEDPAVLYVGTFDLSGSWENGGGGVAEEPITD